LGIEEEEERETTWQGPRHQTLWKKVRCEDCFQFVWADDLLGSFPSANLLKPSCVAYAIGSPNKVAWIRESDRGRAQAWTTTIAPRGQIRLLFSATTQKKKKVKQTASSLGWNCNDDKWRKPGRVTSTARKEYLYISQREANSKLGIGYRNSLRTVPQKTNQ
jgi:hypothetical protein